MTIEKFKNETKRRSTPKQVAVGIDCEAVRTTHDRLMLARISIVSEDLTVLFDEYVLPTGPVVDYITDISGITPRILKEKGKPFDLVMKRALKILEGKIWVAHSIHNDLKIMKVKEDLNPKMVRDTSNFLPLRKGFGKRPSLKRLTKIWFNKEIQNGSHSSVEDAKATMRLYLRFKKRWDKMVEEREAGYKKRVENGKDGVVTEYF